MRTNVVLDDALIAEAARLSGLRTKREIVHAALSEFVASKRRLSLLDLRGKVRFAPGYDHQRLREGGAGDAR